MTSQTSTSTSTSTIVSTGTQIDPQFQAELEFQEKFETSCPIKYPQEVAYRPIGYKAVCACSNSKCSKEKTKVYKITYEYRPRVKDVATGEQQEIHKCLIDFCEHHCNQIKNDNGGVLPTFIGNSKWDAMDTISYYCE